VPAPTGRHVLAELDSVAPDLLDDAGALTGLLRAALTGAGATVRRVVAERFSPQGVTVLALLAESHASIHTWPEHGTAHVDVFTCGDAADPVAAARALATALGARVTRLDVVDRGGPPATVTETIAPGLTRSWQLGTVHHHATTPHQRVLIADTAHGVTLFCDDERQSAQATQLVYHEALFVPAALLARVCERVLVVGSGEGVVGELALAAGAGHVDHVDLDLDCVRACARHLPYGYTPESLAAAERHDGPVHLHHGDGAAFVQAAAARGKRYDVVVVDLPDERADEPDAQLNRLYAEPFLRRCAELLTPGGVVVSQAGSPALWRSATLHAAWRRFHAVFGQVVHHSSDEHEWTFLLGRAQAGPDPVGEMVGRLSRFDPAPVSIDAAALRAHAVAPFTLRHGGVEPV
jgi:spermidine synthase